MLEERHQEEGKQEGAQIDRPVVDAESLGAVGLVGYARDGSGDQGLEDAGTEAHYHQGDEYTSVSGHLRGQEIAATQQGEGHHQHAAVTETVGHGPRKDGQEVEQGLNHALDHAHVFLGDPKGIGKVHRQEAHHAVVGATFKKFK